jgi:hypothetical protein
VHALPGGRGTASGFALRSFLGVLTVDDAAAVAETAAQVVGKQCAHGRGFIRREPLALQRAG